MFTGNYFTSNKNITLNVTNLITDDGKVSFFLFDEVTFMKSPLKTTQAIIVNGKSSVTFKNLVKGEYSIICFHDMNDNGIMDVNNKGIPSEAYGVSNNIITFGPPTFFSTKFSLLEEDVNLEIKFY
jgi:uncharacterized protein (DUF2141 family)